VRSTHAGFAHVRTKFDAMAEKKFVMGQCVKNRQEPCHIVQVAEIVAGVKSVELQDVADAAYENSRRLFGWDE
jgi:TatD DNase family protein